MNLVPNKQLLVNASFQPTKFKKKELCAENKVGETIGDLHCPTCSIEKCVYITTNKRLVSTTLKSESLLPQFQYSF